jgi:hypothetical protein
MSAYHITRFVLDHALVHAMRSADPHDTGFWQGWLDGVLRMLPRRKLPPGLRAGLLQHGSDALAELVRRIPEPPSAADAERVRREKEARWIERRDEGNRRAAAAIREKRRQARKLAEEESRRMEYEKMMPVWKARLEEYVRKRDAFLTE